jgi:hypothetical protein
MTPDGSRLAVLAQQGAEAANLVVAEKSADISRKEPSGGHNDRTRRARSEVVILHIMYLYIGLSHWIYVLIWPLVMITY